MLFLLLRLGFWQLERAEIKDELLNQFAASEAAPPESLSRLMSTDDASQWHYRQARVTGAFIADRQYLLDNRTHEGKAGYHVLTPFDVPGGIVVVNRGWVPVGPDRRVLPPLPVSESSIQLSGRVVPPPNAGVLLGSDGYERDGWPRVVQTVDLERMSQQFEKGVLPALLQLDPTHEACLTCVWRPVGGIGPERHRGYALQWFSLAAVLVVLVAITVRLELRSD
jgi:surfeit locus 1 family protein